MNRKHFFDVLRDKRSGVFDGRLSVEQVRGIEGILDAFVQVGDKREKTLAYALATAYHETGRKMVPVREGFAKSDHSARRIVRHRRYGKPAGPYGHVYYGRGQVQLTWLANYRRSSKDAGVDLVRYPDKALDPLIGAKLLIAGLIDGRWNGRGEGIQVYLPDNGPDDLRNARRTVNITDKWQLIGQYYTSFLKAIRSSGGVPIEEDGGALDLRTVSETAMESSGSGQPFRFLTVLIVLAVTAIISLFEIEFTELSRLLEEVLQ